jgi:hypothetical protein
MNIEIPFGEIEKEPLTIMQQTAIIETIDHVADIARSWANLQSEESTIENTHFLAELCLANRAYVIAQQNSDVGEKPTTDEKELAFLGEVLFSTHKLARNGFFTKNNQAFELASMMTESHFDPRAVARIVNNPAKYVSKELTTVTPETLTGLLYVWSEVGSSLDFGMTTPPSMAHIYQAAKYAGINLDLAIGQADIDMVIESLRPRTITVTPMMISDPLKEGTNDKQYDIFVPQMFRHDDELMSFEHQDTEHLRWTIGNVIGNAYLATAAHSTEFTEREIKKPSEIPYDISDEIDTTILNDRLNPINY